mmetsp:Transcript_77213/g.165520  ORF Transcript_77213/g.165520 Transcript_77213/m.165520 type:complete len:217 (+) Transcript_77213:109-759(+)
MCRHRHRRWRWPMLTAVITGISVSIIEARLLAVLHLAPTPTELAVVLHRPSPPCARLVVLDHILVRLICADCARQWSWRRSRRRSGCGCGCGRRRGRRHGCRCKSWRACWCWCRHWSWGWRRPPCTMAKAGNVAGPPTLAIHGTWVAVRVFGSLVIARHCDACRTRFAWYRRVGHRCGCWGGCFTGRWRGPNCGYWCGPNCSGCGRRHWRWNRRRQ